MYIWKEESWNQGCQYEELMHDDVLNPQCVNNVCAARVNDQCHLFFVGSFKISLLHDPLVRSEP